MMQQITTEELIQYLYEECNPERKAIIEQALQADYSVKERYEQLQASKQDLDSIRKSPRKVAIDKILQYAARTEEVVPSQA